MDVTVLIIAICFMVVGQVGWVLYLRKQSFPKRWAWREATVMATYIVVGGSLFALAMVPFMTVAGTIVISILGYPVVWVSVKLGTNFGADLAAQSSIRARGSNDAREREKGDE